MTKKKAKNGFDARLLNVRKDVTMKKLKILLIAVIVILMGVATWFVYTADYKYTGDIASLQQAMLDFNQQVCGTRAGLHVEILNITETERGITAFVRQRFTIRDDESQSFGFVRFERGSNRRYRLDSYWMEQFIPYSNFVMASVFPENPFTFFFRYVNADVAIAGFNVGEAHKFGIRFTHDSAFITEETGIPQRYFVGTVLFPIESKNFVKEFKIEELIELAEFTEEFAPFAHIATVYPIASLYDAAGREITSRFEIPGRNQSGRGNAIPPSSLNMDHIYYILLIGAILIGLVIRPPGRKRSLQTQQSQNFEPSANQAFEPEADPLDKEKS